MKRRAIFLAALAILAVPIFAAAQEREPTANFTVTVQADLVPDQIAAVALGEAVKQYIIAGYPEFVARDLKQVTVGQTCRDNNLSDGGLFYVDRGVAAFASNGVTAIYRRSEGGEIGAAELEVCIYNNRGPMTELTATQAFTVIDPLITRAVVQSINPYRFTTPDLPGMTGVTLLNAAGAGIYNTRMNLLNGGFYQRFAYEWTHPEVGPFVRAVKPGKQESTARPEVWDDAFARYVTVTLECAMSLCRGDAKPPAQNMRHGQRWVTEILATITNTSAYDREAGTKAREQIFTQEVWPTLIAVR